MEKPKRCIDPIMKYCQGCRYGHCLYPEWVETAEDLEYCTFDTVCMHGFDKGRPEDEPTEEEWKEFDEWYNRVVDEWNDIGCTSFKLVTDELKELGLE